MIDFWSWEKIEAGHYVLTTDDGYTATVRKGRYDTGWTAEAVSPSGRSRTGSEWGSDHETMADAREWALHQIDHLVQQDETELVAESLRSLFSFFGVGCHRTETSNKTDESTGGLTSGVTMRGPGDTEAWFTIEGDHHTYKIGVERWNG
jgi:hypothetical protein